MLYLDDEVYMCINDGHVYQCINDVLP